MRHGKGDIVGMVRLVLARPLCRLVRPSLTMTDGNCHLGDGLDPGTINPLNHLGLSWRGISQPLAALLLCFLESVLVLIRH